MRQLLFSVTRKQLKITSFKGSGPGGQHRNKTETAIRIEHPESGAVATSTTFKSQEQNKRSALHKLVATSRFQAWHKVEAAKRVGAITRIDKWVEDMMQPSNCKVEIKIDGKWVEVDPESLT